MAGTGTRTLVAKGFGEVLRPGTHEMSGSELARFGQIVITVTMIVTNLIGAARGARDHAVRGAAAVRGPTAAT